ncbi:MAG: 60S ribosomal protein L31 [Nitrososphaeria archaeon]|nr:60S ribosomal protein L31 [Aigarchaeota archaeon]MCX8187186.1 60S ribosomal protein L31 [Nitrososphaeria archaeon]MDW8021784.1 50S ribosomal protein L31e [Nitrososphaerota archaeon]
MSEIILERIYTVPLRDAYEASRRRRAKRAINILREFAERHMKSEDVRISEGVNRLIWGRGAEKPPRKITVMMRKDKDGIVRIMLPEEAGKEEGKKEH